MGNRRPRSQALSVQIELLEVRRLLSHDDGVVTSWTRYGDANLNGIVNLADFNLLAGNFGFTTAPWNTGTSTIGAYVNLSDFNRLAMNFGLSASPNGPTPEDWAALAASVGTPPVWTLSDDGTLLVRGTFRADTLIVDAAALSQVREQNPRQRIRRINVDAGTGDDVVRIEVALPATIFGGAGNDTLVGGPHLNVINGGDGNDSIIGGRLNDRLNGNSGNDTIRGGYGNDTIDGGAGNDSLVGDHGHDLIRGGSGHDVLRGQAGDDTLIGGHGSDRLDGGAGRDTFDARDAVGYRDRIYGESSIDRILSSDSDDRLDMTT